MDIRQELGTRLQQKLIITPQLQVAIRLLQLSRLELADEIRQQLDSNPALEESETGSQSLSLDEAARESDDSGEIQNELRGTAVRDADDAHAEPENPAGSKREEIDWERYVEGYSMYSQGPQLRVSNEDFPSVEATVCNKSSLVEHLMWQLKLSDLPRRSQEVGAYVIGNINEDGYLVDVSDEEIAEATETSVEHVREVLSRIREFDPVGVASRDLRECLLTQAQLTWPDNDKLQQLINNHLPDLEKRNFQVIARALKLSLDDVKLLIDTIQSMEPKPGRLFSTDDIIYIQPDVYVIKVGDEYMVVVNDDGLPKLKISQYYEKTLAKKTKGEAREFVQDKLKAASWLIKSINQRQTTIRKVTESIMRFQRDFLDYGVEQLKPLVLREVADDVGMHQSTISRVTTSKYVHTPQGIFELKYFFTSRISGGYGVEDHSSMSVKSRIKMLIDAERPNKPLSDQEIVEILEKEDMNVARRTVAKYREALGISPSSRRKELM
jgi:RNA polymerase sigma-54 factor